MVKLNTSYLVFNIKWENRTWSGEMLSVGYMIVIFQGVYLLITTTFDLGFLVLGKMSSKLIVLRRLFATAVLTLNQ